MKTDVKSSAEMFFASVHLRNPPFFKEKTTSDALNYADIMQVIFSNFAD